MPLSCTVHLSPAVACHSGGAPVASLKLSFHHGAPRASHAGTAAAAANAAATAAADAADDAAMAAPSLAARQRDPTYGQISQYKKDSVRPKAGVILVPVASAASAAVSFNPKAGCSSAVSSPSAAAAAAAGDAPSCCAERPGYATAKSAALHHETVDRLAVALSAEAEALHAWVAAESERVHRLPGAFKDVWEQYERRDRERQAAPHGASPSPVDDESGLDVETLHARLRRRMRHSMHVMMQESNPESYYKDIVHPERVD